MTDEKQPEDLGPQEDQDVEQQPEEEPEEEKDDMTLVQEQLEEALREKEQFRTLAQRAQADLINYRKRVAEEQEEIRRNANSQLLLKILGVADDLDRAIAMIPQDAVAPGWLEGLELVQRNLALILESEGVSKIEAMGQHFEPWEHEAVLYQETPEAEEGKVTDVIRDGYKLHDRVLRAAQVVVSKAPEPEPEEESETTEQEA